jgi:hypothetical protein
MGDLFFSPMSMFLERSIGMNKDVHMHRQGPGPAHGNEHEHEKNMKMNITQ